MHKLICTNCGKEIIRREPQRYKNIFCCKFCESEFRKGKLTREPKKNEIILLDNYAVINIKNNKLGLVKCLIDKEDVDIVKDYFWNVRIDPRHPECSIYVESHKNKKRTHLHRLITNCPDGKVVDHINGDGLDNRKNNLRIVTQKENARNNHFSLNINYVKRDDIYNVLFKINNKTKYLCYTRDIKEAEYYANIGKLLLKENKIDELFNMPCKQISLPRNNKTGTKGVCLLKNGKFQAHYKNKYLGTFTNIEEAIEARKTAENIYQLQNL